MEEKNGNCTVAAFPTLSFDKGSSMDFVPFKKLEPQKLEQNLKIMEEGNGLLKKWSIHFLGNRKLRLFRERLFKGEFLSDIPPAELISIMRVKDIRWEMLCAFSPLIAMRARVWSSRVMDSVGDRTSLFEVLYQEGNLAFDDALFGYLGVAKKAKFITYLWRVIDRRLKREIDNENMPLIPPSADGARKLLKQYEMYRASCGKHITFDEYSSMVGLDEEEQLILSKALLSVVNSTDLSRCGEPSVDDRPHYYDYTALSADIEEDVVEKEILLKELKHALAKCIKMADLTSFQKDLLEAMVKNDGETGWKAEVARKYGLSRTRAGQVFERACEKIRLVYESMRDE